MTKRPMLCTDGKVRRLVMTQPPHYGSGSFVRHPIKAQVITGVNPKALEREKKEIKK